MYGLNGKMTAQDGQRDTLLGYLLQAAEGLRDYATCYAYIVSRADDDPNGIWIMEVWRSKEDHDASLTLQSTQDLIAKARPLITGFSDRTEFTPMGGKGLPEHAS